MPFGELINKKHEIQVNRKGRKIVGGSMDIEQVRQGKNSANKDFGLMFILPISIKTQWFIYTRLYFAFNYL
jgi:hypothetical protein